MTYNLSFDPNHNSEQRKLEIQMVMESLAPIDVKKLTLVKGGYPDYEYTGDGDDNDLALADEIVIEYEKL